MSIDLEDRLREMYVAVADQTLLDDPVMEPVELVEPVEPVDDAPHAPRRTRRVVALVGVAAVVIAALVVLATRERGATPADQLKDRPYAIPTWMPSGYGYVDGAIQSDATGSLITYERAPSEQILIATQGDLQPTTGQEQVPLNGGVEAQVSHEPDSGRWVVGFRQRGGPAVTIRADGVTRDEVIEIANGVWYVNRALWDRVTGKGGFQSGHLDAWTPPGDTDAKITVDGSAQTWLRRGVEGFSWSRGGPACRGEWLARGPGDNRLLLVSLTPIDAFEVTVSDGRVLHVDAASPPGFPSERYAAIEVDGAGPGPFSDTLATKCIGGAP